MQKDLPIKELHQQCGAEFDNYGAWRLPSHYGDTTQEYKAVRQDVGLCDLSHQGPFLFSGADCERFLQGLITNDLSLATQDKGIFALLLTGKGKMIADFYLFRLAKGILLDIDHGNAEPTVNHLKRFRLRSKVDILAPTWAHLLVSGPKAAQLLELFLGRALPDLSECSFFETEFSETPLKIIRRPLTGEQDFHLYFATDKLESVWNRLSKLGKSLHLSPFGQETLETLRIEAGQGRYGVDFNEDIIPVEANLQDKAISTSKGCYPGQEVIARIKTYGHVNKKLTGLVLEGETAPEMGDLVYLDEKKVGWVTSTTWSPALKKQIAFAYLRQEACESGHDLRVKLSQTEVSATVQSLPFYRAT